MPKGGDTGCDWNDSQPLMHPPITYDEVFTRPVPQVRLREPGNEMQLLSVVYCKH